MSIKKTAITMLLILSVALSLALYGCGGSGDEAATDDSGVEEGAVGEVLLEGEQLVGQKCTQCHSLDKVYAAEYDAVGWEATIDRMVEKGAKVTAEEAVAIAEYLANR